MDILVRYIVESILRLVVENHFDWVTSLGQKREIRDLVASLLDTLECGLFSCVPKNCIDSQVEL